MVEDEVQCSGRVCAGNVLEVRGSWANPSLSISDRLATAFNLGLLSLPSFIGLWRVFFRLV